MLAPDRFRNRTQHPAKLRTSNAVVGSGISPGTQIRPPRCSRYTLSTNAPVAQLDRVSRFERGGRELESLRARQLKKAHGRATWGFFVCGTALERFSLPPLRVVRFGSPATAGQIASDLAFGEHDDTLSVLAKTAALTHPGAPEKQRSLPCGGFFVLGSLPKRTDLVLVLVQAPTKATHRAE